MEKNLQDQHEKSEDSVVIEWGGDLKELGKGFIYIYCLIVVSVYLA